MKEHCFRLYTWQLPEWDITKDKRDPTKGSRAWGDDTWITLKPLYARLEKKIGHLDFLWCFSGYDYWFEKEVFRLWELDVPSSDIYHFLVSDIWESLFQDTQNKKQYNEKLWENLIIKREEGIKILSSENKCTITPLIKVPISSLIRIVNNNRFNTGIHHGNTPLEKLPTSEDEALKYRDPSYLIEKRKMKRLRPKKD